MKHVFLMLGLLLFVARTGAQEVENAKLVQQLQLLKGAVLAHNKQAVATFFRFPLTNNSLIRKIEGFEKEAIPKKISRTTFLKYYDRLFTPEVIAMFKNLEVHQLTVQAELIVEMPPKSKADYCTRRYEIVLLNNQVIFSFLLNRRQDITLPEEADCEEYAEFWQFNWQGGKLQFDALEVAG